MPINIFTKITQGAIIAILGGMIYTTGHRYFRTGMANEFDSKTTAQITVLAILFGSGIAGPVLLQWVDQASITMGLTLYGQFGVILIISRLYANSLVPNWTNTDSTSIFMYVFGGMLVASNGDFLTWLISLIP